MHKTITIVRDDPAIVQDDPASRVKIDNVRFQNIRGTSASDVAINLVCSSLVPCDHITLENINLKPLPPSPGLAPTIPLTACTNVGIAKAIGFETDDFAIISWKGTRRVKTTVAPEERGKDLFVKEGSPRRVTFSTHNAEMWRLRLQIKAELSLPWREQRAKGRRRRKKTRKMIEDVLSSSIDKA
ncbi:hypothetical protein IEQ34_012666 [Dendrobium chrysotoxum]|uniref:Polygalacturonase n=1 Tax=Dendrobium chrysotoxum TaxID=161865 RepID=A0AAV7GLB6_DENCH|nr:hypothetical protein IEQ34_012666 [Dendrobium chrysotoxum]